MRVTGDARNAASAPKPPPPSEERIDAALARAEATRSVLSHGCADCCGVVTLAPGGGERLLCTRAAEGDYGAFRRAAVVRCGVPRLYREALTGARTGVTPEDVRAAMPRAAETEESDV